MGPPCAPRLLTGLFQGTGVGTAAGMPCYDSLVENRTEPKTARQWVHYIVVAIIALFLVWWMLRLYVL